MSAADGAMILSLWLDDAATARFNELRTALFPPERNFLAAHVTLFHKLPEAELERVTRDLETHCAKQSALRVRVTGLRSLGGGVAFQLESEELQRFRKALAKAWEPWLSPQDRQGFRPHITVQNKVSTLQARATLRDLEATFTPGEMGGIGVRLWRYLHGPWELIRSFSFVGERVGDVP